MIAARAFAGRNYAVLGLARSGMATVECLLASGAQVTAWDRQQTPRDKLAGRCALADPMEIDLAGFDGVVVSPGVPLNAHPIVEKAHTAGVPIIGDIELFAQARADLPPHKVVGITGTNGKSTTTALVHHLLEHAGIPARLGGNIGLPILAQEPVAAGGVYVLELSSYQIDLTQTLDCDAAALTNITPDHLDRYDGFAAYAAAKSRLFAMQGAGQFASFGCTDAETGAVQARETARRAAGRAVCVEGAELAVHQPAWASLQGPHNLQNAAIACALVEELGVSRAVALAGLATYPGLPHRMEVLGTFNGVLVINDSKATNAASTGPALAAWPATPERRIHWICGGLPKAETLDECMPHLGNVAAAYTIGEAGPLFATLLDGHCPVVQCEMLCTAAERAINAAKPGDIVMLSPACASFDQFRDYEVRGDSFREIVAGLTAPSEARLARAARP